MLTSKSNSNEVLNIDFNIYPNPTTGLLKVALPPSATTDANTSIQVLDVMGRQIFLMENVSQNQSEIAIDLTKENPGIYYLEVKNGEKSTAKSFVLTR